MNRRDHRCYLQLSNTDLNTDSCELGCFRTGTWRADQQQQKQGVVRFLSVGQIGSIELQLAAAQVAAAQVQRCSKSHAHTSTVSPISGTHLESANAAGDAVQDTMPEFNIAPSTTSKAHQDVHVQHTDAVKILQGPEKPDATSAPELCQDAAPPQPSRAQTQLNYLAQKDITSGGGRDPQGDAIPRPPQPGSQGRSDKWAQYEGSSARHQAGPQPKRQMALSPSQASSSLCFQSEEWAGRYGTCAAHCGSISESVERQHGDDYQTAVEHLRSHIFHVAS